LDQRNAVDLHLERNPDTIRENHRENRSRFAKTVEDP
jgi:hypothetical protein